MLETKTIVQAGVMVLLAVSSILLSPETPETSVPPVHTEHSQYEPETAFSSEHRQQEPPAPDGIDLAQIREQVAALTNSGEHAAALKLLRQTMDEIDEHEDFGPDTVVMARAMSLIAQVYKLQKRHSEAVTMWKQSLVILTRIVPGDSDDIIEVMEELANAYDSQGLYELAREMYKKVRSKLIQRHGTSHLNVAQLHASIGQTYMQSQKPERALKLFKKSLVVREALMVQGTENGEQLLSSTPSNHAGLAFLLDSMGHAAVELSSADSVNYFSRSVSLKQALLEKMRANEINFWNVRKFRDEKQAELEIASSKWGLANALYQQTHFAKSVAMYHEALALKVAWLGANHSDSATLWRNIGVVQEKLQEYDLAIEAYEESLAIMRTTADQPQYIEMESMYENLAGIYKLQDRYEDALRAFDGQLGMQSRHRARDAVELGPTLNNIGILNTALHRHQKALESHEAALAVYRQARSITKEQADTLKLISKCHIQLGKSAEALRMRTESLTMRLSVYGNVEMHSDVAADLDAIAALYFQRAMYEKSIEADKRALKIRQKLVGKNSSEVARHWMHLADGYRGMRRYNEALGCLRKSAAIYLHTAEHLQLSKTKFQQGVLLLYLRRVDEARTVFGEARALRDELQMKDKSNEHLQKNQLLVDIGAAYYAHQLTSDAVNTYWEAHTLSVKQFGQHHPKTIDLLNDLGLVYLDADMNDNALQLYEEAIQRNGEAVANSSSLTTTAGISFHNAGLVLMKLKMRKNAIKYLNQAIKTFKAVEATDASGFAANARANLKLAKKLPKEGASEAEKTKIVVVSGTAPPGHKIGNGEWRDPSSQNMWPHQLVNPLIHRADAAAREETAGAETGAKK